MARHRPGSFRPICTLGWLSAWAIVAATADPLRADPVPDGDEILVNQFTTGTQTSPSVGMSDLETFVVVWSSNNQDGEGAGIVLRKFPLGNNSLSESVLNQTTADDQTDPILAMNGSGDFAVVWDNGDSSNNDLATRASTSNGSILANEVATNVDSTNDITLKSICRFADGKYAAAWASGAGNSARMRLFNANGTAASGSEVVLPVLANNQIHIGCLPDGNFLLVTLSLDGDGLGIFAQLLDSAGAALGDPYRVNEDETENQVNPKIDVGANGDVIVAWVEETDTAERVELRRLSTDGDPVGGDQFVVERPGVANLEVRDVDVANDGAFVLVFQDPDAAETTRAVEYSRTGTALEVGGFVPNGESDASRADAGVGLATYVLAWQLFDGTNEIRAQRYVRRSVFADDFESGDESGWSSFVP